MTEGLLYTFRRCPYAMRARIALAAAEFEPEVREIVLARKPESFLALSPKGTVPVMRTREGRVLEESMDIVYMALETHDPRGWMATARQYGSVADELIANNDGPFKRHLDRYKYTTRYDDADRDSEYREACACLQPLEDRVASHGHLLADAESVADVTIWPFVRQFANVEPDKFAARFPGLERWRQQWQVDPLVTAIMKKVPEWQPDAEPVGFGATYGLTRH